MRAHNSFNFSFYQEQVLNSFFRNTETTLSATPGLPLGVFLLLVVVSKCCCSTLAYTFFQFSFPLHNYNDVPYDSNADFSLWSLWSIIHQIYWHLFDFMFLYFKRLCLVYEMVYFTRLKNFNGDTKKIQRSKITFVVRLRVFIPSFVFTLSYFRNLLG